MEYPPTVNEISPLGHLSNIKLQRTTVQPRNIFKTNVRLVFQNNVLLKITSGDILSNLKTSITVESMNPANKLP